MWKRVCAQIVSAVKFVVLGSVIFNQLWILQLVNIPQNTLNWITQNKIYACLMTFFLGNFVETQLLSTGAFEIYVNDIQVWSKLRTGRVPAPGELMSIISSQLKNTGAGITAEDMML
jgi:selT/selW/selH-like putative selenoprotein